MKLCSFILAAGYSTRMGDFKPLKRLGGENLIARAIHLFQSLGIEPIFVVTGHRKRETWEEAKRHGAEPLYNRNFNQGMFSSVKTGCAAVAQLHDSDGFFIMPVDIPLVRKTAVAALVNAFDKQDVLHPVRSGRRGHPPLLPVSSLPHILSHDGSGGLKTVLRKHRAREIPVWDDGPFMDADTSADFANLVARERCMETGSRQEAEALAALYMPPKGLAHGRAVARVATALAHELSLKGVALDMQKVFNSALLHDIAKGQPDHEASGAKMMNEFGLNNLAEAISGHRDAQPVAAEKLSEKEVVCLADKLVRGTRMISIRERYLEKMRMYKEDSAATAAIARRLRNALLLQQVVEETIKKPLADIVSALEKPYPLKGDRG